MKRRHLVVGALLTALGITDLAQAGPVPGGTLDPTTIPKYVDSLPLPGVMPKAAAATGFDYQIAARQFPQQILPAGLPATTVWGYGAVNDKTTFSYPARTIEAKVNTPVKV